MDLGRSKAPDNPGPSSWYNGSCPDRISLEGGPCLVEKLWEY